MIKNVRNGQRDVGYIPAFCEGQQVASPASKKAAWAYVSKLNSLAKECKIRINATVKGVKSYNILLEEADLPSFGDKVVLNIELLNATLADVKG